MKRLSSSDSLGNLMFICQTSEEQSPRNRQVYAGEFQSMLEGLNEDECMEESGHVSEKKRRLSVEQVKALEKNFDEENKLEPERKVKLAQELGLQPRQVAVWFQNRRARWKTKQLERDYGILKANYDSLKLNYDALIHDKESMAKELKDLKAKLNKESSSEHKSIENEDNPGGDNGVTQLGITIFPVLKSRSSDSDSSGVLNEENSSNAAISPFQKSCQLLPQYVKMEEHNFFTGEETCDFFADEQAPTLQWYGSDQWN